MSKIEVGKTYQTRDGKNVRILATDINAPYPIVGAVLYENGVESVSTFRANGHYSGSHVEHKFDLIIPPERKSGWVNLYHGGTYHSRTLADLNAGTFRTHVRTHVLEIITEDGKPVEVKIHEVSQDRATQGEG